MSRTQASKILILVAALAAVPVIAHGQHAAPSATRCANPFPYGPEQFLDKLLVVADEIDPHASAVAAKFEQVFSMKLRFEAREHEATKFPTYESTECEWYAPVVIAAVIETKPSPQERTLLSVGNRSQALLFHAPAANECLSPGLAEKSLVAGGWHGGSVPTDTIRYLYRKGHAELSFTPIGAINSSGAVVACVPEMNIRYQ